MYPCQQKTKNRNFEEEKVNWFSNLGIQLNLDMIQNTDLLLMYEKVFRIVLHKMKFEENPCIGKNQI